MSDVTTVVHGAEDAAEGADRSLERDLGHVEATTEQHAETIEEHGEKIEDVKEDAEWTKRRIEQLEATIANLPAESQSAVEQLRAEIDRLSSTVASLVESGSHTPAESGESTSPPPETENKAQTEEVSGPFAGLRKLLHRLL